MAEDTNIVLEDRADKMGKIEIAPEVLEIILGIAAEQVDGVYQMRGSLANNINAWLGRTNRGKGVTLTTDDNGELSADVYVYLNYGVAVPKVALDMQQSLQQQLLYMTDLKLKNVNVHVVGVVPEKTVPVNPEDLFKDDDEDDEEPEIDRTRSLDAGAASEDGEAQS
ncbi:hypothetical protein IV38_GL000551 [Lactobacillus selangorensis]|uniref:Alkaline shock protein n=1 Tax=Lactobacillus selangorensis TaxID=81857 RepID=A0A0R2FZ46_9LACO|nr:Asp23/Gls24 family envelope stress response protein [Lactobacillus selangorensis]KRN29664.1 hypothetical protein IV38_GL000551 [Lactobacillus selangorensis]KRN33807.1 hypothetical protein IV40_GL000117 [Lactobacillus selangorensis]